MPLQQILQGPYPSQLPQTQRLRSGQEVLNDVLPDLVLPEMGAGLGLDGTGLTLPGMSGNGASISNSNGRGILASAATSTVGKQGQPGGYLPPINTAVAGVGSIPTRPSQNNIPLSYQSSLGNFSGARVGNTGSSLMGAGGSGPAANMGLGFGDFGGNGITRNGNDVLGGEGLGRLGGGMGSFTGDAKATGDVGLGIDIASFLPTPLPYVSSGGGTILGGNSGMGDALVDSLGDNLGGHGKLSFEELEKIFDHSGR